MCEQWTWNTRWFTHSHGRSRRLYWRLCRRSDDYKPRPHGCPTVHITQATANSTKQRCQVHREYRQCHTPGNRGTEMGNYVEQRQYYISKGNEYGNIEIARYVACWEGLWKYPSELSQPWRAMFIFVAVSPSTVLHGRPTVCPFGKHQV